MTFLINGKLKCGICRKDDVAFLMKHIDYGDVKSTLCMPCFNECKRLALEKIKEEDNAGCGETASGSATLVSSGEG